jgi:hypothetical protein
MLLDAIADRVPRDAQTCGRARDVPAGRVERLLEMGSLGAVHDRSQRRRGGGVRGGGGSQARPSVGKAQQIRGHDRHLGQQRHALHRVDELADVARPPVGNQRLAGVGCECLRGDPVVGAPPGQEVLRE